MHGDRIVIEAHHRSAAEGIDRWLSEHGRPGAERLVVTVAGESGSGKSETAAALAECLAARGHHPYVFQQDDYFRLPPKSNDRRRREGIDWVGPGEVRIDRLNADLDAFRAGAVDHAKPLVRYAEDRIDEERVDLSVHDVAIAEGTYTSLLDADVRVFIDRDWQQTRAHREKRRRDASELDPFIDRVLEIEHAIISAHKARADLVIDTDYAVNPAGGDE
jgi:uridine kinase